MIVKKKLYWFKEYVFKEEDAKEGFNSYIENREPKWKI